MPWPFSTVQELAKTWRRRRSTCWRRCPAAAADDELLLYLDSGLLTSPCHLGMDDHFDDRRLGKLFEGTSPSFMVGGRRFRGDDVG